MESNVFERIATALELIASKMDGSTTPFSSLSGKVGVTYSEWTKKWVAQYKEPKIKVNYLKSLNGYLANYILPAFGLVDLGEITSLRLQEFLLSIESKATRTKCAAILSESLRKAYDLRMISFNPFPAVDFDKYEQPTLGALTHAEQEKLLATVRDKKIMGDMYDKRKVSFIYLLLVTGLRQGEALALTSKSIDYAGKRLKIDFSKERNTNKLVSTKTKAGKRLVPVEDELLSILRSLARKSTNGFLFPWTSDYASKMCSKIFEHAGIKGSGHMLRHTFITNCYELGIPAYVIQRWVGHSQAKQADVYLALRNADEFLETEIVSYMIKLKDRVVPKLLANS